MSAGVGARIVSALATAAALLVPAACSVIIGADEERRVSAGAGDGKTTSPDAAKMPRLPPAPARASRTRSGATALASPQTIRATAVARPSVFRGARFLSRVTCDAWLPSARSRSASLTAATGTRKTKTAARPISGARRAAAVATIGVVRARRSASSRRKHASRRAPRPRRPAGRSARTSGLSFDYDCNGVEEGEPTRPPAPCSPTFPCH